MDTAFRGVPSPSTRQCTPAFIKTRTASRMTAMQARGMDAMAPADDSPSWATMSGFLPNKQVVSQRLTSVHIGSSRFDSSVSYPEYNPSSPSRTSRSRSMTMKDQTMANDTGRMQSTRKQSWNLVGKPVTDSDLVQVNWPSSTKRNDQPCFSPIQKNHTNSTKRELEMFGSRPVSPPRGRPGRLSEYAPVSKISTDGSFGNEATERVYKSWSGLNRGKNMSTGQMDGGAVNSSGPRGRVPSVGLNSGRIDTIVQGF
mmetsp:Transcript_28742/g.37116  ORF Transcript_28742/g.37116 Transcript_28742/m.37116 type:complete len:256 (+) Transcript_28742:248-1015(+)